MCIKSFQIIILVGLKDTVSYWVTVVTVNYAGESFQFIFTGCYLKKRENAVPSQVINLQSFAVDVTDVTCGHTLGSACMLV